MRGKTKRAARPARTVSRVAYDKLHARLEELEDLLRLRDVTARTRPGDYLPVELVERHVVGGEHPVRIWREHRGLSLAALAAKSGVPQGYLSEIENRKKPGSVAAFRALSQALEIPIDNLVP
jgi:ribosome-binding protein aMBF1 (putative translation factor)